MPEYRVVWEIDLDAPDPRAAAEAALSCQQRPWSTARVFKVSEFGKDELAYVTIDLCDEN